jgi:predicted O-linked N-acetylglucosamine transferase (SPINDLY family)
MLWKLLRSAFTPGAHPLVARGLALRREGRLSDAEQILREAVQKFPRDALASTNLAIVLLEQDKPQQGIDFLQQALESDPHCAAAHHNFANMLRAMGRLIEAADHYRKACNADPRLPSAREELMHTLLEVCDCDGAEVEAAALRALVRDKPAAAWMPFISPLTSSYLGLSVENQKQVAAFHAAERASGIAPGRAAGADAGEPRRLRIGYLSRDFRDHPVGHLLRNAFALHDREQFDVHAFSFGPDDASVYRRSIAGCVDHFVDAAHLTDAQIADAIAGAGIHVLIDLMGHTTGNRLGVLARRPAPVQAHYLGYPGTIGAAYIDYFVTDPVVTPPELTAEFSEKLVHVPQCFMVSDGAEAQSAPVTTRSAHGLPVDAIVLCSLAKSSRITRDVFRLWMEILKGAPAGLLWLNQAHPSTVANLQREAQRCGVEAQRLVFTRRVPDKPAHMARLALADLALDTIGWHNGHTTTSDALWAGVPVLSAPGATFASRVTTSLLRASGLPELAVSDAREYVSAAIGLAHDRAQTGMLRQKLIANRGSAPFFDPRRIVRDLEAAYREMWTMSRGARKAGA